MFMYIQKGGALIEGRCNMNKLKQLLPEGKLEQEDLKEIKSFIAVVNKENVKSKFLYFETMVNEIIATSKQIKNLDKSGEVSDYYCSLSCLKLKKSVYFSLAMDLDVQISDEHKYETKSILEKLSLQDYKRYCEKLNKYRFRFIKASDRDKTAKRCFEFRSKEDCTTESEEKIDQIQARKERLEKVKLLENKIYYYSGKSPIDKQDYALVEDVSEISNYYNKTY